MEARDLAALEAAGLYDPAAPNAAERLELLEWLLAQRLTVGSNAQSAHRTCAKPCANTPQRRNFRNSLTTKAGSLTP